MKTTENNKEEENDIDIKKINLIKFTEKNKVINISENDSEDNKNYLQINNIHNLEINIKKNNNKNYENDISKKRLASRDYFNNTKSNKNEKNFDIYKSEEVKQLNSNSSRSKVLYNNHTTKNINFLGKNDLQSNEAAKSISDHE